MLLQHHAVQRSGSTFVYQLLDRNGADVEWTGVGQHGPPFETEADGYVVVAKDPWAWLVSYYRYDTHPIVHLGSRLWNRLKHPPVDEYRAVRYLNYYVHAYWTWDRDLPSDRTAWVRYEDLLPDYEPELRRVADVLGLDLEEPLEAPQGDVSQRRPFLDPDFDPSYYTEERYLDEYSEANMEAILERTRFHGLVEPIRDLVGYDMAEAVEG